MVLVLVKTGKQTAEDLEPNFSRADIYTYEETDIPQSGEPGLVVHKAESLD